MPRQKLTFETARELARSLPGVTEGTAWGTPALKVRGKMFACVPTHRSAEPDSLALRLHFMRRDALLAQDPRIFYLPPHYVSHPCVLVRLPQVTSERLRDLLQLAWEFVAASEEGKKSRKARPGRR